LWPKDPSEADYNKFFENLKKIVYNGAVSIEGKTAYCPKDKG
jgi:hypothetical protein